MVQTQPFGDSALTAAAITGALDWWRDAGVDCDFHDLPSNWLPIADQPAPALAALRQANATPLPEVAPTAAPLGGDPTNFPATLEQFQAWWLAEPALDDGQVRDRVPPRGPARAELMIVVAQPEAEDRMALLSGREGRLLDALLAAAGLAPEQVYLASALVRHTPLPDWTGLAARGLGQVLAHHVGLVAPQRLLVFGSNIPPLLGHDTTQNAQILPPVNHEGHSVPVLAARELGALLARPAWKAGLWRQWLDWTGTKTT